MSFNQLLATFYVQTPELLYGSVSRTVALHSPQYDDSWGSTNDTTYFTCTIEDAHYIDPDTGRQRYRYKVDVYRVANTSWDYDYDNGYDYVETFRYWNAHKAGTYRRRLRVTLNGNVNLDRIIYLTIQPDLHVYREEPNGMQTDLVRTDEYPLSFNPMHVEKTVTLIETPDALEARNVLMSDWNEYNHRHRRRDCTRQNRDIPAEYTPPHCDRYLQRRSRTLLLNRSNE
jgi:hypothetical protein